jgi:hypothetical protein
MSLGITVSRKIEAIVTRREPVAAHHDGKGPVNR